MRVNATVDEEGKQALLHIHGDVDFSGAKEVLRVASAIPSLHAKRLLIVLDGTREMPSSTLGLVKLLQEKSSGRPRLILHRCASEVRQLFEMVDLGRYLDIEDSDIVPTLNPGQAALTLTGPVGSLES